MLGLGIDIIALSRMNAVLEGGAEPFLEKAFTAAERRRAKEDTNTLARFAMVFAAKEAIFKAFAATWGDNLSLADIEVADGANGEPIAVLHGGFVDLAEKRGVGRIFLSLSFDGDFAVAVASLS
jgi:phosphopantetheine--protein transferase-like protein